jgi:hypothetical protein
VDRDGHPRPRCGRPRPRPGRSAQVRLGRGRAHRFHRQEFCSKLGACSATTAGVDAALQSRHPPLAGTLSTVPLCPTSRRRCDHSAVQRREDAVSPPPTGAVSLYNVVKKLSPPGTLQSYRPPPRMPRTRGLLRCCRSTARAIQVILKFSLILLLCRMGSELDIARL